MAFTRSISLLALAISACANPLGALQARQAQSTCRPGPSSSVYQNAISNCELAIGTSSMSAFCSSFFPAATTVSTDTTVTVNGTSIVQTVIATPPSTVTISNITSVTSTIVTTVVSASASPTFSFNTATTTSTYTVNSTVYICATPGATSISSSSTNPVVTKRQDPSTSVALPTACVSQLINFETWQLKWGICHGCLGIPTTTSVSTVYTSTYTITNDATIISVITPTITTTSIQTSIFNTTSTATITSAAPTVIFGTSTIVTTTTVTRTLPSPQPTRFSIFYTNTTADGTAVTYYGRAANLTNGDSTAVQFSPSNAPLDQWSLDPEQRLEDLSDNEFVAKNTVDYLPWLYLLNGSAPADTPSCVGCNSTLFCDYPNTTGNSFSICGGFLALGPAATLNSSSLCSPITLQYGLV